MSPGGVDWVSAVAVLVFGLVVGGFLIWRMRGAAPEIVAAPEAALEQRDLLAKRDALVRQLVELDEGAAKRSPEQLARERYDLELETARVLMEIDQAPAPSPETAPAEKAPVDQPATERAASPPAEATHGSPALRGFLWATGTMVALAGLVFFVTEAARPREPGGSPTGGLPEIGSPPGPVSAEVAEFQEYLRDNPDDLEARLALAREHLRPPEDMMGVWTETQYVLDRSPGHPLALTYQAIVRLAMGQPDLARDMLEEAIATAPDTIEAYTTLAMAYVRLGERESATRILADAQSRFPDEAAGLADFQTQVLASSAAPPPSGEANPHASIPPSGAPGGSPGAAPAPVAVGPREVGGILDLDPALDGQLSGVVFLILREAGEVEGAPLAVQRLTPRSFPVAFQIGEDDSMTGEPLPEAVLVEARLDTDGDPMTRPDTDPRARVHSVTLGTGDVSLVLGREG